jgi:hypothetical protein
MYHVILRSKHISFVKLRHIVSVGVLIVLLGIGIVVAKKITNAQSPVPNFTEQIPAGGLPRWWNDQDFHQQEVGLVAPVVQSGVVRVAYMNGQGFDANSDVNGDPVIVRDAVTFDVAAWPGWSSTQVPALDNLRYRYILHTPGATGSGARTLLSGVLQGQQTTSWDSTEIPDGTYAVSIELLGGGADPDTAIDRFKSIPITIIVDNTPGAVTGEQWLPVIGYMGMRSRWAESFAVDWVRSTETPLSPAAQPYPYEFVTPPRRMSTARRSLAMIRFMPRHGCKSGIPGTMKKAESARPKKGTASLLGIRNTLPMRMAIGRSVFLSPTASATRPL